MIDFEELEKDIAAIEARLHESDSELFRQDEIDGPPSYPRLSVEFGSVVWQNRLAKRLKGIERRLSWLEKIRGK